MISLKFLGLAIDIVYKIEGFSHIKFQPVNFQSKLELIVFGFDSTLKQKKGTYVRGLMLYLFFFRKFLLKEIGKMSWLP